MWHLPCIEIIIASYYLTAAGKNKASNWQIIAHMILHFLSFLGSMVDEF